MEPNKHKITGPYILLILIGMICNMGCTFPFATREPEEPQNKQSSWIQPTTPSYVIANLVNSIREKNITNYLRCLADTSETGFLFRFIADPAVANNSPGLFTNWRKDHETNYMNQLLLFLPDDSLSQLSFTLKSEINFVDSVALVQEYELEIHHKCNAPDCPTFMKGQSELRLVRNQSDLWFIYQWRDDTIDQNPSWSQLKAYFGK